MCRVWCLQSRSLATSNFDCKSTSSKCMLSYTVVKTSKFTAFLPLLCTVKHYMQWVHYKNPVNVPYLAANQIVALSVQLIDFSLSTIKKSTKNAFNHRNYIWQNIINRVTWRFICERPLSCSVHLHQTLMHVSFQSVTIRANGLNAGNGDK